MTADKPTVFVLDDDVAILDSLSQLLQLMKLPAEFFSTVSEFLDVYDPSRQGCLLLDLRLPVLSGLEVYLNLKSHGRAVPTVIITGYAKEEAETIETLTSFEDTGCLFKPFEPEQLLRAIETLGGAR